MELYIFAGISWLLGAGIGSFLNVVVLRGEAGETLRGRSRCDSCKKTLTAGELIPILSFFLQKGRCRQCGTALFWHYPVVEAFTGFCFALSSWVILSRFGLTPEAAILSALSFAAIAAGIVAAVADFRTNLIPNKATAFLALVGCGAIAFRFFNSGDYSVLFYDFGGAVLPALFLGGLWLVSRGTWMGLGDVKLIFATSLIAGFPASFIALLFSFWLGALAAILLWAAGKKSLKDRMPFGPYILAGAALSLFLTDWFLGATGFRLFF